jgi:MFS family permease
MLGTIGAGAVLGALALPKFKKKFGPDKLVVYGTLGTAAVLAIFAYSESNAITIGASLLAGMSWIAVLTNFNVSAQTALPNWVRARGLAVYLMVFFGSLALGSTIWGQVASIFSVQTALMSAAVLIVLGIPLTRHAKLGSAEALDLSPSSYWPEPLVGEEINSDRGPVMVTIEYEIETADKGKFLAEIHRLSSQRYRDGAFQWGVYQDTDNSEFWTEWFLVSSWVEHLRQHERVTMHDKDIQAGVIRFHKGEAKPLVRHFLAPNKNKE